MKRSKKRPLTSLWEEQPASLSASQDCVEASQTPAETWPLNFVEYLQQSGRAGLFGKTSPVFIRLSAMKRKVLEWIQKDGTTGESLRKRQILQPSSQHFENAGIAYPGGCWTLNFSECPNVAVESSLLDILETTGDHLQRYYLSPKACAGILRRAQARGGDITGTIGRRTGGRSLGAEEAGGNMLVISPLATRPYADRASTENSLIMPTQTAVHEASDDDSIQTFIMAHGQPNAEILTDQCPTLNCNHEQPIYFEQRVGRNGRGSIDSVAAPLKAQNGQTGKGDGTPCILYDRVQITSPQNRSNPQPGDPSPTLSGNSQLWSIMPMNSSKDYKARKAKVSRPVTTQAGVSSDQGGDLVHSGKVIRRLTPLEFERLQGFPDGYTAILGADDTPRYQAIGNSMPIPVINWLGKQIDHYDKIFR